MDIKIIIAFSLVLLALFFDLKSRIIPDWIMILGMVCALIFGNLAQAFIGGSFGLLFGCVIDILSYVFLKRNIGGGDIKIMAMIGALAGTRVAMVVLPVSLFISLIHGFLANKITKADSIAYMPSLFVSLIIGINLNAI